MTDGSKRHETHILLALSHTEGSL